MEFLKKQAPLFTFGILVFAFIAYMETRIGGVEKRLEARIDGVEKRLEARMDRIENKIDSVILLLAKDRKPAGK